MKKFTTTLCLAVMALIFGVTASAQETPQVPSHYPTGTVDLVNIDPSGMNFFEIYGTYTVNREFNGFAQLFRDGVLLRQLPFTNEERVYTHVVEGYTETKHIPGPAYFEFYQKSSDPGSLPGVYTVKIPAGALFTNAEQTETNPEWEFTVKCEGMVANVSVFPEPGKTYSKLEAFRFTIPEGPLCRFAEPVGTPGAEGSNIPFLESLYGDGEGSLELNITHEGNVAVMTFKEPVTTPGTYFLNIPAGFYEINEGTEEEPVWKGNKHIDYRYLVALDLSEGITITPDPKETQMYFKSELKTVNSAGAQRYVLFEMTLPDPYTYVLMSSPYISPLGEDGQPTGDQLIKLGLFGNKEENPNLLYVCNTAIPQQGEDPSVGDFMPAPGDYALVFPANCYQTTAGRNGEFFFSYIIGVNEDFKVTVSPANGAKLKNLKTVTVSYDEGMEIVMGPKAYAHITNGITEYAVKGEFVEGLSNEVRFKIPFGISEAGEWLFSTPAEDYTVNGMETGASAKYVIDPELPELGVEMAVSPAEGMLDELQVIRISFPAYESIEAIAQTGGKITLTKVGETPEEINIPVKYFNAEEKCFYLDLETPIIEKGTYKLAIEADALEVLIDSENEISFLAGGKTFTWQVSGNNGVEGIEANDAPADVYNAAGICVLRNADEEAVRALDKGLYIYKGRKLIVK